MRFSVLLIAVATAMTTPSIAQMGPGYGSQWNGPNSGWMPWQGSPYAPMMGWGPGYGMGSGGPDGNPGYGGTRAWGDPNMPGRGRFAAIDSNEDGFVSSEEAASSADVVFSAMDADDDGTITLDEFMAVRMGAQIAMNPERQALMQARKKARFDPMDTDSDGSVSKAEFMSASKAHFDAADTDQDGKVTPWEIRASIWN
jgi:hypothetical protein